MGLLLSRQRTHQHHQHDAELLETLKRIERHLETLVQEQRQWIAIQTQWRQEDIAWRDAEQARVWQLAEEAKAHAQRTQELAMQEVKSAFLPYTGDGNVPTQPKRRRVKSVSSEQASDTDTSPVPSIDDAPTSSTEQASA